MNNIQIKRGNGEPPQLLEGELGYSLDTEKLYIGKSNQSGNTVFESSQSIDNQFSEINEKIDNHIIVNNLNNTGIITLPTVYTVKLTEQKTGKLIIQLPQTSNGFYITCNVKIYDYNNDTVCTYVIGNSLLSSTLTWGSENINAAACIGDGELSGLPVVFGIYNSNIPVITIGDSTSTWSNGCLIVIENLIGSIQYYDYFSKDWNIYIDTDILLTNSFTFNTAKKVKIFEGAVRDIDSVVTLSKNCNSYKYLVFGISTESTGVIYYLNPCPVIETSSNFRVNLTAAVGTSSNYESVRTYVGLLNKISGTKLRINYPFKYLSHRGGGSHNEISEILYLREIWGVL